MKTYTPGFFWTKVISLAISVVVFGAGVYDLWFPARLVFGGARTRAAVVRVDKVKPGFTTEVYTTTQPIAEDKNRSAVFTHYIEFNIPDGASIATKLNIASQVKPVYGVGEKVAIAYDPRKPEIAVAVYDQRTWAVGFFVALVGLFFGVASFYMALYARTPIEVPADTPDEDPGRIVKPAA
jgi:hypothetical protein